MLNGTMTLSTQFCGNAGNQGENVLKDFTAVYPRLGLEVLNQHVVAMEQVFSGTEDCEDITISLLHVSVPISLGCIDCKYFGGICRD